MPLNTGLIGYYKMDGNSNDEVNARNGTDTSITYSAGNGKIVQGGGFDGTLSKIDLGATNAYNAASATAFSFSCWVLVNALTFLGSVTIIADDSTTNPPINSGFYIALDDRGGAESPTDGIQFAIDTAAGTDSYWRAKSNDGVMTSTGWYHIVCTYDNGTGHIYINNSDSTNQISTGTGNFIPRNSNIYLGAANDSSLKSNCALDEIGMWSRALSASEVSQLYNNGNGLAYPFLTAKPKNLLTLGVG